ncbi:MAG: PmoA family protein [Pirellulales bacterium]|jgi:hypothetical protein|nr:PmoA family protein [Pirellulales bacterium]
MRRQGPWWMGTRVWGAAWLCALTIGTLRADESEPLVLSDGEKPVVVYNTAFVPSPDPQQPWFGRSGFLHPFTTPAGRVVTDAFPADHMHQHALMFAWTRSSYDGRRVDFWNSAKQEGRVEHVNTLAQSPDAIEVALQHVVTRDGAETVVLHETWRVSRVPHPSMNLIDLVSTQVCATDLPLQLPEYHYGGMCVRGPLHWNSGDVMLTSEGNGQQEGNHTRPNWVTMFGDVDDEPCGLAAFSHPSNFRSPQPVRLHPKMPYFCFAPMVAGDFEITPGTPYVSRFRFAAFDGPVDTAALEAVWTSFAGDAATER